MCSPGIILKGKNFFAFFISSSLYLLPISLLTEKIVFSGLVIACLLASKPTNLSPFLVNAIIEGVVLPPSSFTITTGFPASITATTELVVPKSIPIIFPIINFLLKYITFIRINYFNLYFFLLIGTATFTIAGLSIFDFI